MKEFLRKNLKGVSQLLDKSKSIYALVGGLAVGYRTLPRTTKDIDICISTNRDEEAEALIKFLINQGCQLRSILEHKETKRLATARFNLPKSKSEEPEFDLLFASCGIEPEITKRAKKEKILGVELRIADSVDLIAMKLVSESKVRPNDRSDIFNLLRLMDKKKIIQLRKNISLITKRGYSRKKNLTSILEKYIKLANLK